MDLRDLPSYGLAEAAHYVRIPEATLRSWTRGRRYPTASGPRNFQSVIQLPVPNKSALSFTNLVEAHVLSAIRREHQIQLDRIRAAIGYLQKQFRSKHPLADHNFETDGVDLFIEKYGQLINVSRNGQLEMKQIIEIYLRRIERDRAGFPIRLYPFTRKVSASEPKSVVIDPEVSFGRPVLAGTGIPTAVIAERYKAGESMEELAADYSRGRMDIEEAVRCELDLRAA